MKLKHLFAAAIAVFAASATLAAEAGPDVWSKFDGVTLRESRSRAEVLAELEIHRRSGLAALERGEATDYFSREYRVASARYAAMRASSDYAALVQVIAQRRGEPKSVAAAATGR
jgi:hypothetical protein